MLRSSSRHRHLALGAAVLVTLALPAAARASHVREVAVSGRLTAVLSYDQNGPGTSRPPYAHTRLRLRRAGRLVVDQAFGGWPGDRYRNAKSVYIRNLDGDAAPEIAVDLYSGGAHCCFYTWIYDYRSSQRRYVKRLALWGSAGYTLRRLDGGPPEFVSADYRFDYAFTDFADSADPLRIMHFARGHLRPVTWRYPAQLRRDAARWFGIYQQAGSAQDVRGILAAYAGDEALLHQASHAFAVIDAAAASGRLTRRGDANGPEGQAYVRALRRFLRKLRYLP